MFHYTGLHVDRRMLQYIQITYGTSKALNSINFQIHEEGFVDYLLHADNIERTNALEIILSSKDVARVSLFDASKPLNIPRR